MGCPAQLDGVSPEFSVSLLRHHEIFGFSAESMEPCIHDWPLPWFLCRLKAMEEAGPSLSSLKREYDTTLPYISLSGHGVVVI